MIMNILKVEENDTKIENIFHFADIHIRLNSRFEEYKYVFESVYKKLNRYKEDGIVNAIVCIAGDIVHSKIELSPECIMETYNFFRDLSSIYPTIIIGGNHDTLLTNKSRIDSLSAIVYERPLSNFYFLKSTGMYRYNNLVFFIDSLFDEKEIDMTSSNPVLDEMKKDNLIPITIFHGSIPGWRNTRNFVSKEGDKYLSEMNGMSLCMLGDIHMYQIMSEEKPKALYSSSLISQNFGETDVNHGFVKHNIKYDGTEHKLSHEYVRVLNKYRFQDIFVKNEGQSIMTDGKIYKIFKDDNFREENVIAEYGNMRVYGEKGREIESRRVFEYLKKTFPKAKWCYNTNMIKNNKKEDHKLETIEDETDYEAIESYFEIEDIFEIESEKKMALKYVLKTYQEHYETTSNNIQWKLRKLEFNNMFSYGKNNKIDFSHLNRNTIGIFGPNACRKAQLLIL